MGNCSENFVGRWRRKDPTCVFIYFVKQDGEKQAICINFPQFVKYCDKCFVRLQLFWNVFTIKCLMSTLLLYGRLL